MTSKHGVSSHSNLFEVSRKNIIGKNKSLDPTRYNRRLNYRVTQAGSIDESRLINDDLIIAKVKVGDYICTVAFKNVIKNLINVVKSQPSPNVNLQSVIRAVNRAIDDSDILVDCTCPDFCLHEDTEIKLLNGKVVTIKEMKSMFDNNEELWVYSVDENGDFKPGKVSDVWISGYSNELIKITLDNDKEIITTPNHRYMIRNGSYVEAKDLYIGQSLMPLYFRYQNGYENVMLNSSPKSFVSVYKTVANSILSNEIEEAKLRSGENTIAIHHSDFNKLNNYPSNLIPMGHKEHIKYHSEHASYYMKKYWDSLDADKYLERCVKNSIIINGYNGEKASERMINYWKNLSEEEYKRRCEQNRIKALNEGFGKGPLSYKHKLSISNSLKKYYSNLNDIEKEELRRLNSIRAKKGWDNLTEEEYNIRCKSVSKSLIEYKKLLGNNPDLKEIYNKNISEGLKSYWDSLSQEERDIRSSICIKNRASGSRKYWDSLTPEERSARNVHTVSDDGKKNISNGIKKSWESKSKEERAINNNKGKFTRCKNILMEIINNKLDLNNDTYEMIRKTKQGYPKISTLFESFNDAIEYFGLLHYNHKIKSIEYVKYENPIPVYDLTVDSYNNFYVNAGVILHNCFRFSYWCTRYGLKFGRPETRPSKITNPHDKLGATCKHLSAILANKRWLVKLSSVVNEVVKKHAPDIIKKYNLDPDEFIINVSGRPSTKTKRNLRMANRNAQNTSDNIDGDAENNDEELIPNSPFAIKGGTLDGTSDSE